MFLDRQLHVDRYIGIAKLFAQVSGRYRFRYNSLVGRL